MSDEHIHKNSGGHVLAEKSTPVEYRRIEYHGEDAVGNVYSLRAGESRVLAVAECEKRRLFCAKVETIKTVIYSPSAPRWER